MSIFLLYKTKINVIAMKFKENIMKLKLGAMLAISTYCAVLSSSVAFAATPPAAAPAVKAPAVTPELVAKGKQSYTSNCATCHGEKGDGNGAAAAMLTPKPRDLRSKEEKVGGHYKQGGKPEQLFNSITKGLPGTAMAPFASIPEAERWGIVFYIKQTFQGVK